MKNNDSDKIENYDISTGIGIITTATFCLSVVFDLGNLEALGLSFSDVPTTIADHVRDALLWAPGVLFAALAYTMMELMRRRAQQGLIKDKQIDQTEESNRTTRPRWLLYGLLVGLAFLIIILNPLFGYTFIRIMPIATALMMYEIIRWSFSHKRVADSISPLLRKLIIFIIPTAFFIYDLGYAKGISQLIEQPTVLLTLSSPSQSVEVTILRQMEKGILVKNSTGKAIFYRWESVQSISQQLASPIKNSYICRRFNFFCSFNW
ncbi:MAG: hypothetical protein ACTHJ1_00715 [Bordetella sp.]|uniref:hypothetical protein n=1 Tax=Bordetella sp. TaxID=28081 RepID=UPI003F7BAE69